MSAAAKAKKQGGKKGKAKAAPAKMDPQIRISKPMSLKCPAVYNTSKFSKERLDSGTPFKSTGPRRQIYPNSEQRKDGDVIFSGKFESGNLDSVYVRAKRAYEIHISPDPGRFASWFFFKCDNMKPGEYTFVITGFSRDTNIFHHNVQPVCLSLRNRSEGMGWSRIGTDINFWLSVSGNPSEYTLSFKFRLKSEDTMYFAYTYPYTYSNCVNFLQRLPPMANFGTPAKTSGGLEIPFVFWDSDHQKCVTLTSNKTSIPKGTNPMMIIVGRHHPCETNSSYAMEGFMNFIFSEDQHAIQIRKKLSILMIPMMNVDGVVCGCYRTGLHGVDVNRVWKIRHKSIEATSVTNIVDLLSSTRHVLFFLDFHGHSGKWNVFSYGIRNRKVPLNELQSIFTRIMTKSCPFFDFNSCSTRGPKNCEKTMRVAYHNRYKIPFAFTLEISLSGSNLTSDCLQFTPKDFREIGDTVGHSIFHLLIENIEVKSSLNAKVKIPLQRVGSTLAFKTLNLPTATSSVRSPRRTTHRLMAPMAAFSANASNSDDSEG